MNLYGLTANEMVPAKMTSTEDFLYAVDTLIRMDVPPNYLGFSQTAYALALSIHEPVRLQSVQKWIYPQVAEVFSTSEACVERNIRKISKFCWDESRETLFEIIGHPLARKPSSAKFLAYLVSGMFAEKRRERKTNGL